MRRIFESLWGPPQKRGRVLSEDHEYQPPAFFPIAPGQLSAPWNQSDFAFRLLRQVKMNSRGRNVFLSPAGLALSLLLLHRGASGNTRLELGKCLGVNDLSQEELNRSIAGLHEALNSVEGLDMVLGNSIWVQRSLDLVPEFVREARTCFHADVEEVDFINGNPQRRIDAWIRDKTRGKIEGLPGSGDPDSLISILTAAYFQGQWLEPFDRKETAPAAFLRSDGRKVDVPMMYKKSYFNSARGDDWTAVSLPYRGNRFHMFVVVPEQPLDEFIEGSNPAGWTCSKAHFQGVEIVKMPRFKIECEPDLMSSLSNMGLGGMFNSAAADFSRMVQPGRLPISNVLCRTFCDVDEIGTTAAAVVDMRLVCGSDEVIVDRPFLFVIEEIQTKFVLFVGAVEDPS